MKKLFYALASVMLGALATSALPMQSAQAISTASFNPARIIDDGVFYNSSSMTVGQIQAFLNSKVPSCDTQGTKSFAGTTRAAYGAARGYPAPYTCLKDYYENPATHANNLNGAPIPSGGQSAAQIIYTAATYYGINPQVLIVLLQKEQGLVTDDWAAAYQYKTAAGYGCPDTAACNSLYFGFYNQVNSAAKQFRNYANYPNSYNYLPGPGNYVRYNPSVSCGGTTLSIQNQATASLYNYTPYQPNASALAAGYGTGDSCGAYGNRNFWLYFNDWFGSTQFPQPIGAALYFQASTGIIYLATDSTRYQIPDWNTMINYGLDTYPVQTVPDVAIQGMSNGGLLTNLVYDSNGVYLVNNNTRYPVSSELCTTWGFSCGDSNKVKPLNATFQTQFLRQGGLLPSLISTGGVTYKVSGGNKQPIANAKTLSDLGLSSSPVLSTSTSNSTLPLGDLLITTPGVIQFSPDPHIYYFDGTDYWTVGDMDSYYDWNLNKAAYISPPRSSYNQTAPTSTTLPSYALISGKHYIIDQGRKLLVPDGLSSLWPSNLFSTSPTSLLGALSSDTLSPLVQASPSVYVLNSSGKHYVQTIQSYSTFQLDYGKVSSIRASKLSGIPQGSDALADGEVILKNDNGAIYVVNNHKLTYISSPSAFTAYGYNWGSVRSYSPSITSDYPLDGKALGNSVDSDGTYYTVSGSSLYKLTASQANDFGAIGTKFTPISKGALRVPSQTLPRFLLNVDDGRVYYASGGSLHYVSSYVTFLAYGGGSSARAAVTTDTIQSFVVGQPI